MKRSDRMERIVSINSGIENVASASFASTMSEYQFHEKQLQQLMLYREEYQDRLNERMKNAITVSEIRDYQYFFATLDNAIELEAENVGRFEQQMITSKQNWLEKKQDTEKISRVAHKFRQQEETAQMKAEQKESDELVLQRFLAKRNSRPTH